MQNGIVLQYQQTELMQWETPWPLLYFSYFQYTSFTQIVEHCVSGPIAA